jgi:regulator of cell morphogenesis and NO signaling
MHDIKALTVREIAVAAPATTRVFEQFKIDYCCGGRRSIEEACNATGVDFTELTNALDRVINGPTALDVPEQMDPSALIDHIVDTHHVFTRNELFRLTALMEKVSTKHGDAHPELRELAGAFLMLCNELLPHMKKEEAVLFPFIQELHRAKLRSTTPMIAPFGTVKHPVGRMQIEHDEAGAILKRMRAITNDYKLPEGACPSFGALYFGLEEIEKDLHRHIHLENNVLFPQAIELEELLFDL